MPSYLGNKMQNEIIALLSEGIVKYISNVNKAKYYWIISAITVRARFVKIFVPSNDLAGRELCNFVLTEILPKCGLEIPNLQGQGYKNGANTKGKNVG